eukprot:4603434-Lingulodinium_polyedra.AAC.1
MGPGNPLNTAHCAVEGGGRTRGRGTAPQGLPEPTQYCAQRGGGGEGKGLGRGARTADAPSGSGRGNGTLSGQGGDFMRTIRSP